MTTRVCIWGFGSFTYHCTVIESSVMGVDLSVDIYKCVMIYFLPSKRSYHTVMEGRKWAFRIIAEILLTISMFIK